MPNNNPTGINAYGGPFEHETPYGAVEKLKQLSREAEMTTNPAINAPKQAQRKATGQGGGGGGRPAAATPPPPLPVMPHGEANMPPRPDYQTRLKEFWQSLAADPGASDQVRAYAAEVVG